MSTATIRITSRFVLSLFEKKSLYQIDEGSSQSDINEYFLHQLKDTKNE